MKVTKETSGAKVQAFIVLDSWVEVDRIKALLEPGRIDSGWTDDMRKFVRELRGAL